ncbi:MAG TPA: hypothetical protein P5562_03445 [Candidatus Woesebacteria bacterium]|nr:hypothetical protein [Candidatus Woesebacteria bacterium]
MKVLIVLLSALLLFGCGAKKPESLLPSSDENETEEMVGSNYVDKLANEKIDFSQSFNLNQEFTVNFKTFEPEGEGVATFKARSIKEIPDVDGRTAGENNKLILVEISVRGNAKNKGLPSTFNQIGDYPSPQFVLVDKANNKSFVETNYFSTAYTASKNLFELDKITLDNEEWVKTALVFEIDQNLIPDLAFRFTGLTGKTEFYDIKE